MASKCNAGLPPNGKVKCDCCGKETLAEVRGNKLIIMDRRHGKSHLVVLTLEDLVAMMDGLPGLTTAQG